MATKESKTGKAGDEQTQNNNTATAGAGDQNATASGDDTKAGSGENKSGDDISLSSKSLAAPGQDENKKIRKPFVLGPVVFYPGAGDEVCRHNGATKNLAFCTKVVNETTINLQAIPDGGAMQWRIDVEHKSVAAPGADAWGNMEDDEEFIEAQK